MPYVSDKAITTLLQSRTAGQMPRIGELVTIAYRNKKGEGKEAKILWSTWALRQMMHGRERDYPDDMVAALEKHGYEREYGEGVVKLKYDASLMLPDQSGNSQGRGESSVSSVGQSGSADARPYPGSGYPPGISSQDLEPAQDYNLLGDQLADFEFTQDLGIPFDQDGSLAPDPVFLNQGAGSQGFSDQAHGNFGQFPTGGYDPDIGDVSGLGNPFAGHARGTQSQFGTGMRYAPDIGDVSGPDNPFAPHARETQSQFGRTGRQRQSSSQGSRTDQQPQAPKGRRKGVRR
ncbi:hypothetical protein [Streptomyces sp. NPDC006012]|uniref:hypothetical protein n=1 Tax=Streptomyces sp. NPDC006012 TaxID=3364739 RepID=UPI003695A22D